MSKLFIFDMGEVLLLDVNTSNKMAEEYKMDLCALEEDFALFDVPLMEGFMEPDDYYRHLELNFDIPKIDDNPFLKYFTPSLNDFMLGKVAQLRAVGHRVVVGSNTFAPHWDYMLSEYPIFADSFDSLYASHEIHLSKPFPVFWRYIMEKEGFSSDDTVFIDDRKENIESAKKLGITTFQYLRDNEKISLFFKQYL